MTDELYENHEWAAKHGKELDQYAGKWVAIDHARFGAAADTLKELTNNPQVKAARHPLFFIVPKPEEIISIL